MEKKAPSPFDLFVASLTIIGLAASLVLAEKFAPPFSGYDWAFRRAGWTLIALAAAYLGIALYRWSADKVTGLDLRIDLRLRERLYLESSYCRPPEVRQICDMGQRSIGENHASADLLLTRMEKCPHLVKKLTRQNSEDTHIRGFYIVYPLTASGVKKIEWKTITSGKSLLHTDIAANFRTAKAVYISMVYGDTGLARANAVFHLINDLKQLAEKHPATRNLYAKPASRAGKRLLREHRFKPIDSAEGIWKLVR